MTTTVKTILRRAKELHIDLWVENDTLKVKGKGQVPPKLADVLKANKSALLAYLKKVQPDQGSTGIVPDPDQDELNHEKPRKNPNKMDSTESISSTVQSPASESVDPVCTYCQLPATDYSIEGLPYCGECYQSLPAHSRADSETPMDNPESAAQLMDNPVVQSVARQGNATIAEIIPTRDWPRRKEELSPYYRELARKTMVVCRAITYLNKEGKPCGAREPVVTKQECGCTRWVKGDGRLFCAACYSSMPQEVQA